jgi:hypothetical protein
MAAFSANKTRAVAIELKEKVAALYLAVAAIYSETTTWTVHCHTDHLPLPNDVKIQLQAYEELEIDTLQLTDWKDDLLTAVYGDTLQAQPPCDGAGSGLFDGSATFDGSTMFDGSGGESGKTFDGSSTFDGSTQFE